MNPNKERYEAWQIVLCAFMLPVAFFVLLMCVVCGLVAMTYDALTGTSPYTMKEALKFWAWLLGAGFVVYWIVRIVGNLLIGT